jgi:multiple sugar transport system permease protein
MSQTAISRPAPILDNRPEVATGRQRLPPRRRLLHAALVYGLLLALTAFILLPVGWMLTAALKPDTALVFTFPPEWFPTRYFHWDTFARVLTNPDNPYARYAINTAILIVANMAFAVVSNSLIAYPFARLRFRGRDLLFGLLIATMLLPAPVLLIPQFLLFFNIGWYDSYLPLTVPALAGNAFFIFLLRQYMRTIPRELDEAARIDGAGHWTIYSRIILPLTAPALTVVALFTFLGVWNDFFGPLLYLQDQEKFTVAVALALERSRFGVEWNELMAANLIAIVPPLVLYFVAQKRLIGGIASVGLKG